MLELEFAAQDAVYPRFTFSPLWEVFASLRVLSRPGDHSAHQSWATHTRSRLAASDLDWGLLSELVAVPVPELPGFLLTPGASVVPDLGVELAALRAAPVGRVRAGIARLPEPRTARLTALHDDPSDATSGLPGLAGVIERYWELAIAPHWPRMLALLESDVLYRGRLLAEGGAPRLLGDLETPVTWRDRWHDGASATAGPEHRDERGAVRLDGRGLLLAPSVFARPPVYCAAAPPRQPVLRYPARGIGTLWETRRGDISEALVGVLGRPRALLLAELAAPASTSTLARRTGLSPGGVSRHLTALRDARLVSAHRTGGFVLYARTTVAEALLARR